MQTSLHIQVFWSAPLSFAAYTISILAWVKVFRIFPEFRVLRLTFHRKSAPKSWIRFFYLISVYPKTIDHLNLKSLIFIGIVQVLRFDFQELRILEILNFHPCTDYMQIFKILASLCSLADLNESYLVANPEQVFEIWGPSVTCTRLNEPRREKTCLRIYQQSDIQNGVLSYRD